MALPSSSLLLLALFAGHAAGQLKCLIYTFLHGEFKQKKNLSECKREVQMKGRDSVLLFRVENGIHYLTDSRDLAI